MKHVAVSNILATISSKLVVIHLTFRQSPNVSDWTQCVASCRDMVTVNWIKVAQQWAALNAVIHLLSTRNMGNFLTS
jgi:hypothetical protein